MSKEKEFQDLLDKWLSNRLNNEDLVRFVAFLEQDWAQHLFGEQMTSDLVSKKYLNQEFTAEMEKARRAIHELPSREQEIDRAPIKFYNKRWLQIAASFTVFIVGIALFHLLINSNNQKSEQIAQEILMPPKSNHAVLVTGSGAVIKLDSLANGQSLVEGNMRISKTADGELIYKTINGAKAEETMNRVENPMFSKPLKLVLADGTAVWLNANSSITYPIAFNEQERKVTIDGELYFEVRPATNADGQALPFIVDAHALRTFVLGTHFNVKS